MKLLDESDSGPISGTKLKLPSTHTSLNGVCNRGGKPAVIFASRQALAVSKTKCVATARVPK